MKMLSSDWVVLDRRGDGRLALRAATRPDGACGGTGGRRQAHR